MGLINKYLRFTVTHTTGGSMWYRVTDMENKGGQRGKSEISWVTWIQWDNEGLWSKYRGRAGWCDSEKTHLSLTKSALQSCHGKKKGGDEPAQNNLQGRQSSWLLSVLLSAPYSAEWWFIKPKWTEVTLILRMFQQASDNWRHSRLVWSWSPKPCHPTSPGPAEEADGLRKNKWRNKTFQVRVNINGKKQFDLISDFIASEIHPSRIWAWG